MNTPDTIAAIATAVGGGLAVIRLSGPHARTIADAVWRGGRSLDTAPSHRMFFGHITDTQGIVVDQCLAVVMAAPHSYTGEDVVEFQCHGGALLCRTILERLLQRGARAADPGEFTQRAFLNGKMDLTQAEAVADLIAARSRAAAHTAHRQLEGRLGRRVAAIYDRLATLLADVESRLDFVDEALDWAPLDQLAASFDHAAREIDELLATRHEGEILRHGIRLVLAGPPNAGKSSLLNHLLGRDRAIVTDTPGTTRDTLEESLQIRGIPITITDTAGIRAATDPVEAQGVARSLESARAAHICLWVADATAPLATQPPPPDLPGPSLITVVNKSDLAQPDLPPPWPGPAVPVCALNGAGIDRLNDAVEAAVWQSSHHQDPEVAVSARHATLLAEAGRHLKEGRDLFAADRLELLAIPVRTAIDALGRIIGRTADPDLLETIFSRFCIGK